MNETTSTTTASASTSTTRKRGQHHHKSTISKSSSLASLASSLQSELSKVNQRITKTEQFLSTSTATSPSASPTTNNNIISSSSKSDFGVANENEEDASRALDVMDSLRAIRERKSRTPSRVASSLKNSNKKSATKDETEEIDEESAIVVSSTRELNFEDNTSGHKPSAVAESENNRENVDDDDLETTQQVGDKMKELLLTNEEEKLTAQKPDPKEEEGDKADEAKPKKISSKSISIPRPLIIATLLALLSSFTSLFFWFVILTDPFVEQVINSFEHFPFLPSSLTPAARTLKILITSSSGFFVLVSCFSSWFFVRKRNKKRSLLHSRKAIGEISKRVDLLVEYEDELQKIMHGFHQRSWFLQLRHGIFPQLLEERRNVVSTEEEKSRDEMIHNFKRHCEFLEASRKMVEDETLERIKIRETFMKSLEQLKKISNCALREIAARKVIYSDFAISYQRNILTEAIFLCLREEPVARSNILNEETLIERRGKIRRLFKIESKILELKLREERSVRGSTILSPERASFTRLQKLFAIQKEEIECRMENVILPEQKEIQGDISQYFIENISEPLHRAELISSSNSSPLHSLLDEKFLSFCRQSTNVEAHSTILKAKLQLLQDEEHRFRNEIVFNQEEQERVNNIESVFGRLSFIISRKDELQKEEAENRRKLLERSEKIEFSDLIQEKNIEHQELRQLERISPSPNRGRARSVGLGKSSSHQTRSINNNNKENDPTVILEASASSASIKRASSLALCASAESIDSLSRKRKDDREEKRNILLQYIHYKIKYLKNSLEGDLRNELEAEETFQRLDLKQQFFVRLGVLEEVERKRKQDEMETKRLQDEQDRKNIASLVKNEQEAREWWEMRSDAEFGKFQQEFRLAQVEISVKVALFAREALTRERYLRLERKDWRIILREAVDDGIFDRDTVALMFSGLDGTTTFALSPVASEGSPLSRTVSGAGGALTMSVSSFAIPNMSLSSFDGSFGSFSSFLSPSAYSPAKNMKQTASSASLASQVQLQQQKDSASKNLFSNSESTKNVEEDDANDSNQNNMIGVSESQVDYYNSSPPPPQTADALEQTQHFEQSDRVAILNSSKNNDESKEEENLDDDRKASPVVIVRGSFHEEEKEENESSKEIEEQEESDDEEEYEVEEIYEEEVADEEVEEIYEEIVEEEEEEDERTKQ